MNVQLLTQRCCDHLLTFTIDDNLRSQYKKKKFPDSLLETLNIGTKFNIPDSLNLSPKPEDDVDSSIAIFKALSSLDRVQANDRRLWVALTHRRFFDYTRERWVKKGEYSDDALLKRFHFEGSGLETRTRNSIARLWWAAKITYDDTRKDPFELTKVLWLKQDIMQNLIERSYGTYENVVKTFLELYRDNGQLSESDLRTLYTGLNSIGGVKVLSILTKDEVNSELRRIAKFANINVL